MASSHLFTKISVACKPVVERVMKRIEKLKDEPFPHGIEKLEGAEPLYRIRVGDYRIVYEAVKVGKQRCLAHDAHGGGLKRLVIRFSRK